MDNILTQIVARKQEEVQAMRRVMPAGRMLDEIHNGAAGVYCPVSLSRAVRQSSTGIIAECKRRSPSRGDIHPCADTRRVVAGYQQAGAAACSVLTDTPFFGGSLADLAIARSSATLPLLRKDFIVDSYQIIQARLFGADAILLIAAILNADLIAAFTDIAHSFGMETLLELHTPEEIAMIAPSTDMVGVNARDLRTFRTDLETSLAMAQTLPERYVKIAESGISSPDDVSRMLNAGFDGVLVGEAFMKTPDPGHTLHTFINEIH